MTVEEKIQAVLIADPTVYAATGNGKRVKVGFVGQSVDRPYISHEPGPQEEVRAMDGVKSLRYWRAYQVSCAGNTYQSAKELALAVISALKDYRAAGIEIFSCVQGPNYYDDDVRVHSIPVEIELAESL